MRSLMIIGLALLLPGCNTWSNKPTVPETSRTAVVHDVRVSLTDIQPADLRANVGDEIRFLNDKTQPICVVLIEAGKSIACNKRVQWHDRSRGGYQTRPVCKLLL